MVFGRGIPNLDNLADIGHNVPNPYCVVSLPFGNDMQMHGGKADTSKEDGEVLDSGRIRDLRPLCKLGPFHIRWICVLAWHAQLGYFDMHRIGNSLCVSQIYLH